MYKVAVFLVLGGVIALTSCSQSGPTTVATPANANASRPTQTIAATEELVIGSGPLVLENQVDVAAQREGLITKIVTETGMRVHTGDLLAQLDDRQVTADLNAARAKSRSIAADLNNWKSEAKVLESDYGRAQKMWEAQLITQEQLDHAR